MRDTRTCSLSLTRWLFHHAGVDVVRERRRRGDGESGDDGQDGREGHRRDDAQQDHPAEFEREKRRGRVLRAGSRKDLVGSDEGGGAVAEREGEQVERADQGDRPHHRAPGLLGAGHRVEAHSTCGRPAVPSTRAIATEMKLICEVSDAPYWAPGASTSRLATASLPELETADWAAPSIFEKFSPNLASTQRPL